MAVILLLMAALAAAAGTVAAAEAANAEFAASEGTAAAANSANVAAAASAPTRPNLIFVLLDDWGWANLGIHNPGNKEIQTPYINSLINSSILLNRHYVFKYCSPSRCALQSGRNPIHVNVVNSPMAQHNELVDPIGGYQGIPLNMSTISSKLAGAGYQTHAVGKWNAGACALFPCWQSLPTGGRRSSPSLLSLPGPSSRRHGHQGAHAQGARLPHWPHVL